MPLFNLPPDTRVVGSGNPPADMDALVDVLNHTVYQRRFYLDQYGADPTGVTLSDTAWTNCYADAAAACQAPTGQNQAQSGVIIVLGAGIYNFSIGVVSITDQRIGLIGAGKGATTIRTTGSSGVLINYAGGFVTGLVGAPVGGFTLWGWGAGNNVDGLRYGDTYNARLFDISADGFTGTGANGIHILSTAANGGIEGTDMTVDVRNCTTGILFDGGSQHTSADYSRIYIHVASCANAIVWNNGAHAWSSQIVVVGTMGGSLFASQVLWTVGNSGTDTAQVTRCHLHVGVEADSGATTVTDFVIQGASGNAGIRDCYGSINLLAASMSWTAGSLTGGAQFTFTGVIVGVPLLTSSLGSLYQFGHQVTGFDSTGTNGKITAASLDIASAGQGLMVAEGSNAKQGTTTLNGTTAVVVSNTSVTANSRIFLSVQSPGGVTPGVPYVSARTAGTSFSLKSSVASDNSVVAWEIFEPG